eukprot:1825246-Amphidinium_carterae.1
MYLCPWAHSFDAWECFLHPASEEAWTVPRIEYEKDQLVEEKMGNVFYKADLLPNAFFKARENTSDNQYHSKRKKNKKFQEHRYTPQNAGKMSKTAPPLTPVLVS